MDDDTNLDLEFKRYLQILRPYLSQLTDNDVISVCNAWIQRLSDSQEHEKTLRNKYVFAMCYQLAKGNLDEPFLQVPPTSYLRPLQGSICSDDSSTEIECLVVNADDTKTEVLYNNNQTPISETEYPSQTNDFENTSTQCGADVKSFVSRPSRKQTVLCYTCPEMMVNCTKNSCEVYEERTRKLIEKLREIKTENTLLHNELCALKEESITTKCDSFVEEVVKVDNSTSAYLKHNVSNVTLKSLKFKLQEVQESRKHLIDKISDLQEQLDNFDEIKKTDIENMEAKHKLEIINLKSAIQEEVRESYEKKHESMKEFYEIKLNELKKEIQDLKLEKKLTIEEKTKTISLKDAEINTLKNQIDDLKTHLHSVLENFVTKPSGNSNGDSSMQLKAEQLEKRLNKMDKNKTKCARMYEAKLTQMQREKHLIECSLQLQMVRQRAQVVNEVTDENQVELATALDKLETKYKEIVANVQATAIQRRMQDQLALESILQAACGIPNENNNSEGSNQFSKTMRNQNRSYDSEVLPLMHCNRVGNVSVGNKSFVDDSVVTGYCLNGERMGELFERVYIPQRDNPETK